MTRRELTAKMTTGIQQAMKLQEVPPEKFGAILARSVTGGLLSAVGVGLLYVMGRLTLSSTNPSVVLVITLLSAGGGFLLVGGHMVSRQVRQAVSEFVNPVRKLRGAITGRDERVDGK